MSLNICGGAMDHCNNQIGRHLGLYLMCLLPITAPSNEDASNEDRLIRTSSLARQSCLTHASKLSRLLTTPEQGKIAARYAPARHGGTNWTVWILDKSRALLVAIEGQRWLEWQTRHKSRRPTPLHPPAPQATNPFGSST